MAGLPALRGLRTARGLSQNSLYAELYALHGADAPSRQTIANYESGATTPSITQAEILADFFEVTLDELAGRSGSGAATAPAAEKATDLLDQMGRSRGNPQDEKRSPGAP